MLHATAIVKGLLAKRSSHFEQGPLQRFLKGTEKRKRERLGRKGLWFSVYSVLRDSRAYLGVAIGAMKTAARPCLISAARKVRNPSSIKTITPSHRILNPEFLFPTPPKPTKPRHYQEPREEPELKPQGENPKTLNPKTLKPGRLQ